MHSASVNINALRSYSLLMLLKLADKFISLRAGMPDKKFGRALLGRVLLAEAAPLYLAALAKLVKLAVCL